MVSHQAEQSKLRRPSMSRMASLAIVVAFLFLALAASSAAAPAQPALLDPKAIPKYVNQLTGPPPVYMPDVAKGKAGQPVHQYAVDMVAFEQQILPPGFPTTPVWGYGGYWKGALTGEPLGYGYNSPGATFEAVRGIPIEVTWRNTITSSHMFAVDPTLHWADPNELMMPMPPFEPYPPGYGEAQYPVPLVTHLHGGEVQSTSDGGPEAWFTWDGMEGPAYSSERPAKPGTGVFDYPNMQPATTLWYHDHALGITRINVMSGLAGFYLLRDPADTIAPLLPSGKYEMPLVFQDRWFYQDGSFYFPSAGINPNDHPYWMPEFFGNTIMVNGKVWPNMKVDQGQYRLRLLDGSNARFYTLRFSAFLPDGPLIDPLPFIQIGSDGGYLRAPAPLTRLTLAPGERADVLVDFAGLPAGTRVILRNTAKSPFPNGAPPDPRTVGQLMQFTVTGPGGPDAATLPSILNPALDPFPSLPAPTKTRTLVLWEVMGAGGPLEILLNGQKWAGEISELPELGATEEWVIVNPTADTHPIHTHLVQFQLVSRQKIDAAKYAADWMMLNGGMMPPFPLNYIPSELPVGPYLKGKPIGPPPNEQGWKDTLQMHPGEVTIIRMRFAPVDGSDEYPFDATEGPGYVWHCHILDHEDNEMMRPLVVVKPEELSS